VAVTAFFVMANQARIRAGDIDPGLTTEFAGLLVFGIGADLVLGSLAAATALSGAVAILLQFKRPLHRFVESMGDADMRTVMQFVLMTMVILPIVPNQGFGPYQALNPFKIWLLVVLIVSIGLCGYVTYKLLGTKVGTVLGGVLGGLISSTATTITYARRRQDAKHASVVAFVIMIASTMVYIRVLVLIAVVAPEQFIRLAMPLIAMMGACALICVGTYLLDHKHVVEIPPQKNPADFRSALIVGGIYALVSLAVAVVRDHFGPNALYLVGVLAGLTDMNAITLSMAQLGTGDNLAAHTAWRVILLASMSNQCFNAGVIALLGPRVLFRHTLILFALALLAGGAILCFWPN